MKIYIHTQRPTPQTPMLMQSFPYAFVSHRAFHLLHTVNTQNVKYRITVNSYCLLLYKNLNKFSVQQCGEMLHFTRDMLHNLTNKKSANGAPKVQLVMQSVSLLTAGTSVGDVCVLSF